MFLWLSIQGVWLQACQTPLASPNSEHVTTVFSSVPLRSTEADHMWRIALPTASPITATLHRTGDSATDLTNQSYPSTWMDGHEQPTGRWCCGGTIADVLCDERKEDGKYSQILLHQFCSTAPRMLYCLQGQDILKWSKCRKKGHHLSRNSVKAACPSTPLCAPCVPDRHGSVVYCICDRKSTPRKDPTQSRADGVVGCHL